MNEELEKKLFNDFPDLFAGKDLPITQNLMSFGCECDDGWFNIIYDFCKKVKDYGIIFVQIKQKFGGLRLYYDFYDEKINSTLSKDDIIKLSDEAEDKSYTTCEICGKDAKLCRRGNWFKTLCIDCRDEYEYEECKD